MGSVIKKVRRVAAQALAILAIVIIIWAAFAWGGRVQIPDMLAGVFDAVGIGQVTHWTLLAIGAGALFCAYVFDDEAAGEMVGIPFRVVGDVAKSAVEATSSVVGSVLSKFNLTKIGLAVGTVYVIGKVIESDSNKPSSNTPIIISDNRPRERFETERSDGGQSRTDDVLEEQRNAEVGEGRS